LEGNFHKGRNKRKTMQQRKTGNFCRRRKGIRVIKDRRKKRTRSMNRGGGGGDGKKRGGAVQGD